MALRKGDVFGKVATCSRCGETFRYLAKKYAGESAGNTSVCEPCYPRSYISSNIDFLGYMEYPDL